LRGFPNTEKIFARQYVMEKEGELEMRKGCALGGSRETFDLLKIQETKKIPARQILNRRTTRNRIILVQGIVWLLRYSATMGI